MGATAAAEKKQPTLFNVDTKEISPYWIDPKQPLLVPVDPRHFEAHKLQLLLLRLERQSETNPAQFNSSNYINTLARYTQLCNEINKGAPIDDALDAGKVVGGGNTGAAQEVGAGIAPRLDPGVSADNPTAG